MCYNNMVTGPYLRDRYLQSLLTTLNTIKTESVRMSLSRLSFQKNGNDTVALTGGIPDRFLLGIGRQIMTADYIDMQKYTEALKTKTQSGQTNQISECK